MSRARWQFAVRAAAALAVDPAGLGGAVLIARAGPVRDAWLDLFEGFLPKAPRRLPPEIDDDRLLGGIDLAATLKAGRAIVGAGLLAEADGGVLIVPMAERLPAGLAARLAAAMDRGRIVAERTGRRIDAPTRFGLVLLDETAAPDEAAPAALADRLAFRIDLDGIAVGDLDSSEAPDAVTIAAARARAPRVVLPRDAADALTRTAAALGVDSLRASLLALRTARALAALADRRRATAAEIEEAALLVLAPRASCLPADDEPEAPDSPPPPDEAPDEGDGSNDPADAPLEDRVLAATRAVLPDLVLADAARRRADSRAPGSGARRVAEHGRPAGSVRAKPDGRARLDLPATLREAAPWQELRRRERPGRDGLIVKPGDFRARRFVRPAESVMIFLVDASGSAAAARLAEAKGAVELMLAEAYRRREKVALIAFRGVGAELLLPPTRSLLAAKRRLAVLPGGGGTPLASALVAGRGLALQTRRRGATPFLMLLTDGRGNIGLDGAPGRDRAAEDAAAAARALAAETVTSVLFDTANRPRPDAADLARRMGARYLPLPRADASGIRRAVRTAAP